MTITTRATTSRMWINPPAVYEVMIPSNHNNTNMSARVQSMSMLLSFPLSNDAPKKKPTQPNPEGSGFICVGLLVNGSSGRWPEYPLSSHPKTSILRRELTNKLLRERGIVHLSTGECEKIVGIFGIAFILMNTQNDIDSVASEGRSRFE